MSFTIYKDYVDSLSESELKEKLSIIEGKKYENLELLRNDLNLLVPADKVGDIVANLQLLDDGDHEEEIIGLNESIYPYDPTKADIDIREDPQTVYELAIRKWDQGKLILDPNFQRNFVWKPHQKSQFIESVILNFPLPALYVNKDKKGKLIIVDGRQRLTTLRSFLMNEFRLSDLSALPQLNGKNFNELLELNEDYRIMIEDKKLHVYMIQPSVPLEMVYDIFNRINTGGTMLERQEIRNCIYMGASTKLLSKLSKKPYWRSAIDNGISSLRKKDEEAILRYLSFQIQDFESEYKGSLNGFVENAMKMINTMPLLEIIELENEFKRVMKACFRIFGHKNFRLPTANTRGRINLAVLESVSYFISQKSDEFLNENKARINANLRILLNDQEYWDAVRYSTGTIQKVKTRFDKASEILGNAE